MPYLAIATPKLHTSANIEPHESNQLRICEHILYPGLNIYKLAIITACTYNAAGGCGLVLAMLTKLGLEI